MEVKLLLSLERDAATITAALPELDPRAHHIRAELENDLLTIRQDIDELCAQAGIDPRLFQTGGS